MSALAQALSATIASALLLGALESAALAAIVYLLVRFNPGLSAATRHALWCIVLAAVALAPLAGITSSTLRAREARTAPVRSERFLFITEGTVAKGSGQAPSVLRFEPAPTSAAAGSPQSALARGALTAGLGRPSSLVGRLTALGAPLLPFAIALWLCGATAGLAALLIAFARLRAIKRAAMPLDAEVTGDLPRWRDAAAAGRRSRLVASNEIDVPIALGFRAPAIVLPIRLLEEERAADLDQIAMHEQAHLQRYDDWTNLFQVLIERIFWINPLAAIVGRRIALEREIACDDLVVAQTGGAHRYATALWRLAQTSHLPAAALPTPGAIFNPRDISVRIEQLLERRPHATRFSARAALAVGGFAVAAVGFQVVQAPALSLPARAIAHVARHEVHTIRYLIGDASQLASVVAPTHVRTRFIPVQPHRTGPVRRGATAHRPWTSSTIRPDGTQRFRAAVFEVRDRPAVVVGVSVPEPAAEVSDNADVVSEEPIQLPALPPTRAIPGKSARVLAGVRALDAVRFAFDRAATTRAALERCNGCTLVHRDLRAIDMSGLTLTAVNMSGADLRGVDLHGARLVAVNLSGARLDGANLRDAVIEDSILIGARLVGAQIEGARLLHSDVRSVSARRVELREILNACTSCNLEAANLGDHVFVSRGAARSKNAVREEAPPAPDPPASPSAFTFSQAGPDQPITATQEVRDR